MITLEEKIERYNKIVNLRSKGTTFREIGKEFNVSKQAIAQFFSNGYPMLKVKSPLISHLNKYGKDGRERAREMVRLRDNHTCQDCGFIRTAQEVWEYNSKIKGMKGKIKSLDVHHIGDMCGKNSTGYDKISELHTMITLCHKCHYNRPEHETKKSYTFA